MTVVSQHQASSRADGSGTKSIIAVGGAKGGIGKSAICANLGVFLASQGYRTTLVDLDLGGANLHLFLGMWSLEHKLQDFLDKTCKSLEDVLVETPYGPTLAGGGGGKLGSAHLPFVRKLKLFRALRSINADYIILDLGGDTTYNSLDYFLAADVRIVMTTCDPASYLDAYNFVKMALYRKLTRIFGPESNGSQFRDPALLSRIEEFVKQGVSGNGLTIKTLLNDVAEHHSGHLAMVEELLHQAATHFIINMAGDPVDTYQLALRIKTVSHKMLSVPLNFLGSIAYDENIRQCTLDLIPHVIRHPRGILSHFFRNVKARIF